MSSTHVTSNQTAEQLVLHPLPSLRTVENLTHHVRTRWEINFEYSYGPHIGQDSLPEMPE